MHFLPTYGRPYSLERLRTCPGGMPAGEVTLIVNADDPARGTYAELSPWPIEFAPAGSRLVDTWKFVLETHPDLPWYGMLSDDHIPQTPGWSEVLVAGCGDRYMAYPNGAHTEFPLMRGVLVIGGDLVRMMGFICPQRYRHNFIDVELAQIGIDNGLLRAYPEVFIDHVHWKFVEGVVRDATYIRGSADQDQDMWRYHQWLSSPERGQLNRKLQAWKKSWI